MKQLFLKIFMQNNFEGKRFQKIKKIGEGTYGSVTKVFDTKSKVFIAVKKLKFHQDEQTIPINALRQIISFRQLVHQNIVEINHVSYEAKKRKLYIGMEYIQQTLEQHMKRVGVLSPFTIKIFLYELLNVLRFLQNKCYMHRDLKPQNIMITKENKIKLIDFGQAKKFSLQNLQKQKNTLEVSTLWYKAPQLLLGNSYYNNKIQIWATACVFAQMATNQPLFESISQIQQIFKIFKLLGTPKMQTNKKLKQWQYMSPTFPKFEENKLQIGILGQDGNDLLRKMLVINPEKRISISEALDHRYFLNIK